MQGWRANGCKVLKDGPLCKKIFDIFEFFKRLHLFHISYILPFRSRKRGKELNSHFVYVTNGFLYY